MYSNFGRNFIDRYSIKDKTKNEIIKKKILIPDIKIKTDQLKKTSNVCPMSGWAANKDL